MEYGITGKLGKKLNMNTLPEPTEKELAYCWEVNFDIAFRKMILFIVNASSRFAVIAFGLKPGDLRKDFPGIAEGLIRQAMRECLALPESAIDAYFAAAGESVLTKTHGKRAVGNMTRLMLDAPCWRLPVYTDIVYQGELTDMSNHEIFKDHSKDKDYRVVMEKAADDLLRLGIISTEKGNMPRGWSYEQLKAATVELQLGDGEKAERADHLWDAVNESLWKHIMTQDEAHTLFERLRAFR